MVFCMTINIMTLSIMTFSIMTSSGITFNPNMLSMIFSRPTHILITVSMIIQNGIFITTKFSTNALSIMTISATNKVGMLSPLPADILTVMYG